MDRQGVGPSGLDTAPVVPRRSRHGTSHAAPRKAAIIALGRFSPSYQHLCRARRRRLQGRVFSSCTAQPSCRQATHGADELQHHYRRYLSADNILAVHVCFLYACPELTRWMESGVYWVWVCLGARPVRYRREPSRHSRRWRWSNYWLHR